jgi:exosortase
LGGWQVFRKLGMVLLFLLLMLPLPRRVESLVSLPLQEWGTASAAYCLEVLGFSVRRDGNVIQLGNTTVAVAEACNGLRMVTAFLVISGFVVLLINRRWWEKLVVLLSALPIGLLCNTVRLLLTAIAFTWVNGPRWEGVFHDFGGYAMMPLAVVLTVLELWVMGKMTIPETPANPDEVMIASPEVRSSELLR